jgi:Bifunctional DNA primase/polymerase, N-terminal
LAPANEASPQRRRPAGLGRSSDVANLTTDLLSSSKTENQADALSNALRLNRPAFPCQADKRPACPHGFKDATADPAGLRELLRQFPGPLVGVPTGEASGLFVIDIDSARHDEANDWLERYSPYLPDTRQHATKSGGWHLLFKHLPGLGNSASKLAKGVDTRGDGGYIIWWPFHLGLLAPHKLDYPLADLPDELIDVLLPTPPVIRLPHRPAFGKPVGEPNSKIQGILNAVAAAQEGERNKLLFWGACRISDMIAEREIGASEGARAFEALNFVGIGTGLSPREIARTIRSAVQ